jgi:pimeloyl-ACP methyl ester carboxylesterase
MLFGLNLKPRPLPPRIEHPFKLHANGIEIVAQAFGNPRDPAVLLIMGANAPMMRWPESLCLRIAAAGRYVIRYDNRDTGQSTPFRAGAPGYDIRDLAQDAVAVLDFYGVDKAHVAGFSMGGMIVQHLAIYHSDRVLSALISSSSPDPFSIARGDEEDALSLPWPKALEMIEFLAGVDWTDYVAAIDAWVFEELLLLGSGDDVDEKATREIITEVVRYAKTIDSHRINHPIAVANTPRWRGDLRHINVPTLVLHGMDDAALPIDHGRAIAREIPNAEIIEVEGMGHIIAPRSPYWLLFADTLIDHSAR